MGTPEREPNYNDRHGRTIISWKPEGTRVSQINGGEKE